MASNKTIVFEALENALENGYDFRSTKVGEVAADLQRFDARVERMECLNALRDHVRQWQSYHADKRIEEAAEESPAAEESKAESIEVGDSMLEAFLRGTGQQREGRTPKQAEARLYDLARNHTQGDQDE